MSSEIKSTKLNESTKHSPTVKVEKDFVRPCPSKLSKGELEELYFALVNNNTELKKALNLQLDKIRQLNTKVARLSNIQKSASKDGNGYKPCCGATRAVMAEQTATITELKKSNERMAERIRILNMRLCSARQFLKRSSPPATQYRCPRCSCTHTVKETSVPGTKVNTSETADAAAQLTPEIADAETGMSDVDDQIASCKVECAKVMDSLQKKITSLENELSSTHDEYSSRTHRLEQLLERMQQETSAARTQRAASETKMAAKLEETKGLYDEVSALLSMEKKKVAELTTQLKSAQLSNEVARTIETHLSNEVIKRHRRQEAAKGKQNEDPKAPSITEVAVKTEEVSQLTPDDKQQGNDKCCRDPSQMRESFRIDPKPQPTNARPSTVNWRLDAEQRKKLRASQKRSTEETIVDDGTGPEDRETKELSAEKDEPLKLSDNIAISNKRILKPDIAQDDLLLPSDSIPELKAKDRSTVTNSDQFAASGQIEKLYSCIKNINKRKQEKSPYSLDTVNMTHPPSSIVPMNLEDSFSARLAHVESLGRAADAQSLARGNDDSGFMDRSDDEQLQRSVAVQTQVADRSTDGVNQELQRQVDMLIKQVNDLKKGSHKKDTPKTDSSRQKQDSTSTICDEEGPRSKARSLDLLSFDVEIKKADLPVIKNVWDCNYYIVHPDKNLMVEVHHLSLQDDSEVTEPTRQAGTEKFEERATTSSDITRSATTTRRGSEVSSGPGARDNKKLAFKPADKTTGPAAKDRAPSDNRDSNDAAAMIDVYDSKRLTGSVKMDRVSRGDALNPNLEPQFNASDSREKLEEIEKKIEDKGIGSVKMDRVSRGDALNPNLEPQFNASDSREKLEEIEKKMEDKGIEVCWSRSRVCRCPRAALREVCVFRSCSGTLRFTTSGSPPIGARTCADCRQCDNATQPDPAPPASEAGTYTVERAPVSVRSLGTSPDSTRHDVPSIGESSKYSSTEEKSTGVQTNSEAQTYSQDNAYLSEGEVPRSEGERKLSSGERPLRKPKVENKQTGQTTNSLDSDNKMESALQAINLELMRCRRLLQSKREEQTSERMSESRQLQLRKVSGAAELSNAPPLKCVFTLHIGTIVLSDEAVKNTRNKSLILTWRFYDQSSTMTHVRGGRVAHFDFSTEYDVKITDQFIRYLKHKSMQIQICELEQPNRPFARAALPLRDVLLNLNQRVDMSLALMSELSEDELKRSISNEPATEVGVIDLWCTLRAEPWNLSSFRRQSTERRRQASVQLPHENSALRHSVPEIDLGWRKSCRTPSQASEAPRVFNHPSVTKENFYVTPSEEDFVDIQARCEEKPTKEDNAINLPSYMSSDCGSATTNQSVFDMLRNDRWKPLKYELPERDDSLRPSNQPNLSTLEEQAEGIDQDGDSYTKEPVKPIDGRRVTIGPNMYSPHYSGISGEDIDDTLSITVVWLSLNEESAVINDPLIQRLYVAYSFLGQSGAELETPISLPKPRHQTDKCFFDFKKSFTMGPKQLRQLGHMALQYSGRNKPDPQDCVVFSIVSEPMEDPLGLADCLDIGYAYLFLGDMLTIGAPSYTKILVIHAAQDGAPCGQLAVRVDGLDVARRALRTRH